MSYPLAIYVYAVGARSETFIRRHLQELLPNQTVVLGRVMQQADFGDWTFNGPFLDLDSTVDPDVVKKFLLDHDVRVLMGEYLDDSLLWLDLAKELGIEFFGHAHGYDVSERLQDAKWQKEYLRYNEAGGIITMSNASREKLVSLGLSRSKVFVVPYGVDIPSAPYRRSESRVLRCIAVGRMVSKKAPLSTLDTFRKVAERYPDVRLDYVGDGPLLPAVKQFIQAFGLEGKVVLHGSQPNAKVLQLMIEADVFLQHSIVDPANGDAEGLPVAILEAMAQALPVVATRHSGIPEAVLDGVTGYLVEEGDTMTMSERIMSLVRDSDMRRQMGETGWARTQRLFSWERERTELLKIFGIEKPLSIHE